MNKIILFSMLITYSLTIYAQKIVDVTVEIPKDNKEEFNNKGQRNGIWIKYNSYNRIESKGEYLNGKKINLWQYFFTNGILAQSEFYKKGLKHGEFNTYHTNGNIASTGKYFYAKKDGIWKHYSSNTNIISRIEYSKGKKTGLSKSYYNNGQIRFIQKYKGKKSTYEFYNQNGVLKEKGTFLGSKKKGLWYYYRDNGKLDRKKQYRNNMENGLMLAYHENGRLKQKGKMKKGLQKGKWISYFEDGKVYEMTNYSKGFKSGISKTFYFNNEQLKTEELWKKDLLMEVISFFNIKGHLLKIGSLKKGNGTVNIYSQSGELITQRTYEDGKWKQ